MRTIKALLAAGSLILAVGAASAQGQIVISPEATAGTEQLSLTIEPQATVTVPGATTFPDVTNVTNTATATVSTSAGTTGSLSISNMVVDWGDHVIITASSTGWTTPGGSTPGVPPVVGDVAITKSAGFTGDTFSAIAALTGTDQTLVTSGVNPQGTSTSGDLTFTISNIETHFLVAGQYTLTVTYKVSEG
ncbi:MAG: hypothetical protein P4L33_11155 [Capsulimonadaceae bacterium]|nr:hypothetical protein [Capsulimonadaceae bacterium]